MSKILAIKGDDKRGNEVIALLETLGGYADELLDNGTDEKYAYFIVTDENNVIDAFPIDKKDEFDFDAQIFTLDEYYKKYPYKVGDKVIDEADGCPGVVSEMKWDEDVSDMKYCVAFENGVDFGWFTNDSINFFEIKKNENLEETQSNQDIDKVVDIFRKEFCECCGSQRCSGQDDELEYCERFKNLMDNSGKPLDDNENKFPPFEPMFKMNDELEYMVPDGYEITEASKDKVFIKPIKSKYPKTLGDCCKVIVDIGDYQMCGYKHELLFNFQNLLICRDAYWKIAGEEMGLGKPWKPDWNNGRTFYCIFNSENKMVKSFLCTENKILLFPTGELRDAFYENFNNLIEQCKELL
jgi:hypothetical protein